MRRLNSRAAIAIVLAAVLPMAGCSSVSQTQGNAGEGGSSSQAAQAQNNWWPTEGLATKVPTPASNSGEIKTDSDGCFKAEVLESDEDAYESYVSKCKEAGFTVDAEKNGINFQAWNEEGYELNVNLWEDDNMYIVTVESPLELTELSWPTVGPASVVPTPESLMGKTDVNTSDRYCVLIGNTPIKSYSAYVDALISAGFNVDYSRSEKWFKAENAEGYGVIAEYQGYNIMYVKVDVPEK